MFTTSYLDGNRAEVLSTSMTALAHLYPHATRKHLTLAGTEVIFINDGGQRLIGKGWVVSSINGRVLAAGETWGLSRFARALAEGLNTPTETE